MGVKVRCVTYIDDFKREHWPTEMEARPIKGDTVRSESGKELIVVRVTHATIPGKAIDSVGGCERHPVIEVYLGR